MKITSAIPRSKVVFLEEERKKPVMTNFKRHARAKSFVDTECSSFCSKKEAEISQIQFETVEDQILSEKSKAEVENRFINSNLRDICTISTIDSCKEVETGSNFKRKNKSVSEDKPDWEQKILTLKYERDTLAKSNKLELDQIDFNLTNLKNLKLEEETEILKSKSKNLNEENWILVNTYKEELSFLKSKENVIDSVNF
jgi:hypothetical protein